MAFNIIVTSLGAVWDTAISLKFITSGSILLYNKTAHRTTVVHTMRHDSACIHVPVVLILVIYYYNLKLAFTINKALASGD